MRASVHSFARKLSAATLLLCASRTDAQRVDLAPAAVRDPVAGAATFPPEVRVGVRVQLYLPEARPQLFGPWRRQLVRGTVAAVAGDTLHLQVEHVEGALRIARPAIRRLEAAWSGAAGGATLGVLLGVLKPSERWRRVKLGD